MLQKGTTQPLRKTCWALTAGSAALWVATMDLAVEYAHQWAGPARSVIEGAAVTATVCLVVVAIGRWIVSRGDRRARAAVNYVVTRPAHRGTTARSDCADITMEIPAQARVIPIQSRREGLARVPDAIAGQLYRLGVTDARLGKRP